MRRSAIAIALSTVLLSIGLAAAAVGQDQADPQTAPIEHIARFERLLIPDWRELSRTEEQHFGMGLLTFKGLGSGATVLVDGVEVRLTRDPLWLSVGTHRIEYQKRVRTVFVEPAYRPAEPKVSFTQDGNKVNYVKRWSIFLFTYTRSGEAVNANFEVVLPEPQVTQVDAP